MRGPDAGGARTADSPAPRRRATRRRPSGTQRAWNALHYTVLGIASLLVVTPLAIALTSSFKTPLEMLRGEKTDLPASFSNLDNYTVFIERQPVGTAFWNTLVVVVASLVVATLLGTMAAYALDRFRFRGRSLILLAYIVVMAVPPITTQVSLYQIMLGLGLVNSKWALVVLYSAVDIVSLYIFLQFVGSISREIDESARMEGASHAQVFLRIVLPLMGPAIATVAILRTIHIYNDFVLPYLYTPRVEQSTVSMLLYKAADMMSSSTEAVLMAGIVIVIAPSILAFLLLQRRIVSGVMRGAVKG